MWLFKQKPDAGILEAPDLRSSGRQSIRFGERKRIDPIYVANGDELECHFEQTVDGVVTRKESLPPARFTRSMSIDTLVRIEVIDELGLDVGVGFLAGQSK